VTKDDVSLREYLTALISAAEHRSDERFEAMRATIESAFTSAQIAIDKAEAATEKRFEGVNEFRAALSDQASSFVTRQTLNALVAKLEAQIERNRDDLDMLAKKIDVREGMLEGARLTVGNVIAIVTVGVAVIGLIVVLANYLSGH
jgi:uncharacterized coiled-coil protein SlyX